MRRNLAALFLVLLSLSGGSVVAQSPDGSITGIVLDPDTKSIAGAEIIAVNDLTGVKYVTLTNVEGIYSLPNLPPGPYRIQVSKVGFKAIIKPDIVLNVQDALSINFKLPIGASSVVVTVEGGAPMINTQSATVSTVVDRQFAENLPLNGRSFQSLIYLTPGAVATASTTADSGQFGINGQRPSSNYWMVDGVGANIGVGAGVSAGNGFGGTIACKPICRTLADKVHRAAWRGWLERHASRSEESGTADLAGIVTAARRALDGRWRALDGVYGLRA